MANSFGLLLAAITICFIIARLMKDAKAFTRLMAILAVGLIVGAGVKQVYKKCISTPEKAAVVTVEPAPMYSSNASVVWNALPCSQDYTSKENKADRDSTVTEAEGTSTKEVNSTYIDDS